MASYHAQTPEQSRNQHIQLSAEAARVCVQLQELRKKLLNINTRTGLPNNFTALSSEVELLVQRKEQVKKELLKSYNDPRNKW